MSPTPHDWPRITALFDELRALDAQGRLLRLADLARARPDLADEVASLLEADTDDDFLEACEDSALGRPRPDGTTRMLGQIVGAYRIERELGRGGMGVVYEGRHVDPSLAKRVAIKTLAIGLDRPELAWRFRRERQILAKLEHANIAALYDGGTTADGVSYLVMEYVGGQRIDTWSDAQRLSIPRRLDLFRQVCAAVQFAHSKLIVHRDLKPGNIFVTDDGVVKLLDFGIAKLIAVDDDLSADENELTRAGTGPLTTAYASPEQFRGDAVTTASDVYSLGVILYRLLTGTSPYALDGLSPADARHTVSTQPPRSPSDGVTKTQPEQCGLPTVTALRNTLRGDLDAIVLMALRAEPDRRYVSADALGADILRYLKGLPVQAKPDTLRYRVRRFVGRQRGLVTAVSIAGVALVAGTLASVRSARAANEESARSQRVTRLLQEFIGSGDQNYSRFTSAPTLGQVLDSARVRVATELPDDPRARADLYRTFGNSYVSFNRPAVAKLMLDSAYMLHAAALGSNSIDAIRDLLGLAPTERALGRSDRALDQSRRAMDLLRTLTPANDSDLTRAELELASTLAVLYFDVRESPPLLRVAITRERQAKRPRWQLIARGEGVLAYALLNAQQVAAADSALRRSNDALMRDTTPTMDEILARAIHAEYAITTGHAAEAVPRVRTLLARARARFGDDHFIIPEVEGLLAMSLISSAQLIEGRSVLDAAIARTTAAQSHDPAYFANLLWQKSTLNLMSRDTAAAAEALREARHEVTRMGKQAPFFALLMSWTSAALAMAERDTAGARDHLAEAVRIGDVEIGPAHPMSQLAKTRLGLFNGRFPPRTVAR